MIGTRNNKSCPHPIGHKSGISAYAFSSSANAVAASAAAAIAPPDENCAALAATTAAAAAAALLIRPAADAADDEDEEDEDDDEEPSLPGRMRRKGGRKTDMNSGCRWCSSEMSCAAVSTSAPLISLASASASATCGGRCVCRPTRVERKQKTVRDKYEMSNSCERLTLTATRVLSLFKTLRCRVRFSECHDWIPAMWGGGAVPTEY
jgi:hypothetical protein